MKGKSQTWPYPEWYPLIVAARYYGVPPWELMQQSIWWIDKAFIAMTAEGQAAKIINGS